MFRNGKSGVKKERAFVTVRLFLKNERATVCFYRMRREKRLVFKPIVIMEKIVIEISVLSGVHRGIYHGKTCMRSCKTFRRRRAEKRFDQNNGFQKNPVAPS